MAVHRVPDGAVILTGTALEAVAYAVDVTQRARARNGLPPLQTLEALRQAVAGPGQPDNPTEPGGHPDTVTTEQAATALAVSPRTVRRLAPKLGGQLVGGRWLLDRHALTEHLEGIHP